VIAISIASIAFIALSGCGRASILEALRFPCQTWVTSGLLLFRWLVENEMCGSCLHDSHYTRLVDGVKDFVI